MGGARSGRIRGGGGEVYRPGLNRPTAGRHAGGIRSTVAAEEFSPPGPVGPMLLFCPLCQASFPGTSRCPRCGGLLYMPTETTPDPNRPAAPDEFERPGPAARLGVGVVLGLGLFLGLRQVVSAALLAA